MLLRPTHAFRSVNEWIPRRLVWFITFWLGLFLSLAAGHAAQEQPLKDKKDASHRGDKSLVDRPGQWLFEGRVAITARMSGHSLSLPVEASRCSNCHSHSQSDANGATLISSTARSGQARSGQARSDQTRFYGPPLNQSTLSFSKIRRGGPASRYDALSFCKLLREGIDPASVVINNTMPRYQLSDAQCSSIWSYVMSYS
jgi:hypothetical protein